MTTTNSGNGRWLSLGRACDILGVNETTLRHWANTDRVRTFRTPGRHRRFSKDDLNALTHGAAKGIPRETTGAPEPSALKEIRRRIGRGGGRHDLWLQYFDDEGRARMRVLGRRLVTLADEYIGRRRRRTHIQEEARHLGMDYGLELASRSMGLSDAVSAFIFFRNVLHDTVDQSSANGDKATVVLNLLEVEDLVLVGMAAMYEGAQAVNGTPASPAK